MKHWRAGIWILLIIVAFAGCGKSSDKFIPDTSSSIKFLNTVPGTEEFDALLNDKEELVVGLKAGQQSPYRSFKAKKYDVIIYGSKDRATPLAIGEINLRNERKTTVFIGRNYDKRLEPIVYDDDDATPTKQGTARVRIVSMSNMLANRQGLAMDMFINKIKVLRGLSYRSVSVLDIVEGTHQFNLFALNDTTTSLLKGGVYPLTVKAGQHITLWYNGDNVSSNLQFFTYETGK